MTKRTIILSGKHVALAGMTAEDQPHFQAWLSGNAELRALIDDHRVPTLEDQHKWFERSKQPDRKMFSIITVPQHDLIGNGGFVNIDPAKKEATLRITIGHVQSLGKGWGSEATGLLIKHAFQSMGLERIVLKVLKTNARAIRAYEKNGFQAAGDDPDNAATLLMTLSKS
jgi:RimJ/RimL family protein N-acetyltransferase